MDDRTVDLIFQGSLDDLPPVSSKIVRIFTSSTFTGELVHNFYLCESINLNFHHNQIHSLNVTIWCRNAIRVLRITVERSMALNFRWESRPSLIRISAKFRILESFRYWFFIWRSSWRGNLFEFRHLVPGTSRYCQDLRRKCLHLNESR